MIIEYIGENMKEIKTVLVKILFIDGKKYKTTDFLKWSDEKINNILTQI